jgi:pseudouridine-5'-phosphate glycosidase
MDAVAGGRGLCELGRAMNPLLRISPAVQAALDAHQPIVALETTVITHGLPQPQGLALALELESLVRAEGATPATIGVLDGAVVVGMSPAELARLAGAPAATKVNPGNLGAVVASGAPGSTTVAATMAMAARCAIRVFATGGIGGVHRGAAASGDVSADLAALAAHPVAVVCAGAKAILDLPRTVEALESAGVPVLGFGTGEFPAFYRRTSGLPVDQRFDDLAVLATALRAHWSLGGRGAVVANPIPAADEIAAAGDEAAIARALADAAAQEVSGRAVTPFLLDRMRELTGGASVAANLALLRNNARVAARLGRELGVTRD